MFGFVFKSFAYIICIILIIIGFMTLKDKLVNNTNRKEDKETFYEEEEEEEEVVEVEEEELDVDVEAKTDTVEAKLNNDKIPPLNIKKGAATYDSKIISQISLEVDKTFIVLKKKIEQQLDEVRVYLNNNIKNTGINTDDVTIKKGIDPSSKNIDDYEYYMNSENELSDDDEEDNGFTENFVEEGIYDGITSPYCLNCQEF